MQDYATFAAVAAVVREVRACRAVLGITPSAISQRVRALEDRLGAVLVKRGQPCTATAIGARLCAHVERVRLLEGELAAALPELTGSATGSGAATLRVAVNADSLGAWFMPAVAAFCTATGALVDLALDGEDPTAERLRTGEVLAAVTTMTLPVQGCCTTPLGALRYVATASPDFTRRWFANGLNAVMDTFS
jgi:LysR family transcriptional regulator (chromosome initiation inhibitor)